MISIYVWYPRYWPILYLGACSSTIAFPDTKIWAALTLASPDFNEIFWFDLHSIPNHLLRTNIGLRPVILQSSLKSLAIAPSTRNEPNDEMAT
jgi:hypothetical protein